MDRLLIGFLHIGIALCIFHLGKWMSAAKNPQLLALIEKIKIGDLKNISPRYTMNYIGYFIQFSGITYFALAFMGPFSIAPYLTIPGVAIAAIIYHIASAKNCSPSEAFNKLQLNKNAFSGNVFIRFSIVISATAIATGLIVCYVLAPLLLE